MGAQAVCDEQCGKDPGFQDIMRDDFWLHQFNYHCHWIVCDKCCAVIDASTLQYHKDSNCDEARAGCMYEMIDFL